jgi:hypothetical protein
MATTFILIWLMTILTAYLIMRFAVGFISGMIVGILLERKVLNRKK